MKEVYELDVYRLAEALSDMVGYDFDTWPAKARLSSFRYGVTGRGHSS